MSRSGESRDSKSVDSIPFANPSLRAEIEMIPALQNQVRSVDLMGVPIIALVIDGEERLCLAQISNTLLKQFSYNEIHNRRVALGITCVQCTPVQLEILRRAGAMPISSRRCGMISKREAERLCRSFLTDIPPPQLPENFAFSVKHRCAWGCRGCFIPSRYNSSRAKCIKCVACGSFFSPNKFIFHSHRNPEAAYVQPDAANFNSWRRHLFLDDESPSDDVAQAWEDVKAMFNGGSRKRSSGTNFDEGPKEKAVAFARRVPATAVKTPIISTTNAGSIATPPSCVQPYRSSISIFNQGPSFPLLPYPVPPFLASPFPTAALYASLLERERVINEAKISEVLQEAPPTPPHATATSIERYEQMPKNHLIELLLREIELRKQLEAQLHSLPGNFSSEQQQQHNPFIIGIELLKQRLSR